MPRSRSRTSKKTKESKTLEASIKDLKSEVRAKIAKGRPLSVKKPKAEKKDLEAREIQMRIASMEARAAAAETTDAKPQRQRSARGVRAEIEQLRQRLKS